MYVHVCMYVYIYIYIHTCIHVYTIFLAHSRCLLFVCPLAIQQFPTWQWKINDVFPCMIRSTIWVSVNSLVALIWVLKCFISSVNGKSSAFKSSKRFLFILKKKKLTCTVWQVPSASWARQLEINNNKHLQQVNRQKFFSVLPKEGMYTQYLATGSIWHQATLGMGTELLATFSSSTHPVSSSKTSKVVTPHKLVQRRRELQIYIYLCVYILYNIYIYIISYIIREIYRNIMTYRAEVTEVLSYRRRHLQKDRTVF